MVTGDLGFRLGDLVRDRITGFTGVAVCVSQWLNGCVRLTLQAQEMREGKPLGLEAFDVEQLEVVRAGAFAVGEPSGGPMPDPVRR